MDLGLNETQAMLAKSAREFLEGECTTATVRRIEASETQFSRDLWQQIADLGWLGLWTPENFGGLGLGLLDLALICEEAGRALLPGPLVENAGILPAILLRGGSPEQQQRLAKIAAGAEIVALAVSEQDARWNAADIQVTANRQGSAYRLDGAKVFVPFARSASTFLVAARTGDRDDAISLFLVDAGLPEIEIEPIESMAAADLCAVTFNDLQVGVDSRIGEESAGWPLLRRGLDIGAALLSATMVGGGQRVLDVTTDYAKNRVAFGSPIGTFQAIQHKLVQMLNDLDSARWATYEAIWKLERDDAGAPYSAALAKYLASESYRRICFEAHEVHAGVGFMVDYDLQLFYRRAKWLEQYLGHTTHHRDRLAEELGLTAV